LILKDLSSLITNFRLLPSVFCASDYESLIKGHIVSENLNMGSVMNILRLCLVGSSMGPGVFDIMELLGPDEVVARIERAIEKIGQAGASPLQ
jgi:glutamyl-tRNA synthetase